MPAMAKCYEFCDGVVFAIPGAMGEGDERRTPDVGLAILGLIAHRPDRKIDRAVDFAEPGASLARACHRPRWRGIAAQPATRSGRGRRRKAPVVPFRRRACARPSAISPRTPPSDSGAGEQAERLGGFANQLRHAGRHQCCGCNIRRRPEPDHAAGKYDGAPRARITRISHLTPHRPGIGEAE